MFKLFVNQVTTIFVIFDIFEISIGKPYIMYLSQAQLVDCFNLT